MNAISTSHKNPGSAPIIDCPGCGAKTARWACVGDGRTYTANVKPDLGTDKWVFHPMDVHNCEASLREAIGYARLNLADLGPLIERAKIALHSATKAVAELAGADGTAEAIKERDRLAAHLCDAEARYRYNEGVIALRSARLEALTK